MTLIFLELIVICPAQAGVILTRIAMRQSIGNLSRASGGDPADDYYGKECFVFVPRKRG